MKINRYDLVEKWKKTRFRTIKNEIKKIKESKTIFILDTIRNFNIQVNLLVSFDKNNKDSYYGYNNSNN